MGFDFAAVLAFALIAVLFALGGITACRLVGPRAPDPEKASTYECGERPIGVAWINFNPRFYLVALVFVIFEVDVALTFAVVAVYRDWVAQGLGHGLVALGELLAFTLVLVVGIAWVWARGDLGWVKQLARSVEQERRPPTAPHRAA
jgi:NADH-quinone oxidoreductase subunit A